MHTQSFLLTRARQIGQISIFITIGLFIRFFLFSASPRKTPRLPPDLPVAAQNGSVPTANPTSRLLSQLHYLPHNHTPESLDWINVFLAQIINQYRSDLSHEGKLATYLQETLNGPKKPDFLDDIKLTELSMGEDFPIFSNCRVLLDESTAAGAGAGHITTELDIDLSDIITMGIETRLHLRSPKVMSFVMPVSLVVSVVRFSARIVLSVESERRVRVSVRPEFALEVAVKSLLGSRSMLHNMPRMGQIIESALRKWVTDKVVLPGYREFKF